MFTLQTPANCKQTQLCLCEFTLYLWISDGMPQSRLKGTSRIRGFIIYEISFQCNKNVYFLPPSFAWTKKVKVYKINYFSLSLYHIICSRTSMCSHLNTTSISNSIIASICSAILQFIVFWVFFKCVAIKR